MGFLISRWVAIALAACVVGGGMFYVTTQLMANGAKTEQINQALAANKELKASISDLRSEIKDLSRAVAVRERQHRQIDVDIGALVDAAKEVKDACDDEPLPAAYVEQLRAAEALARGAGMPVPGSAGSVDGSDPAP